MKRSRIMMAILVVAVLGMALSGCLSAIATTGGTGISPVPVMPSTWIPSSQIWEEINARIGNAGAVINIDGSGHSSVSEARIKNALKELVVDPRWKAFTVAQELIVQIHRGLPDAAAGLALLGPPDDAYYWVVTVDFNGMPIIRLVNPLTGATQVWNSPLPAGFVCM